MNTQQNTQQNKKFLELKQGDMVWTMLDDNYHRPLKEKKGSRPVVIISNHLTHKHFGMAIVVPVTNQNFRPRANVAITSLTDLGINGYAEPYQVRTLDLKARKYKYIGKISDIELGEILGKLDVLISPE